MKDVGPAEIPGGVCVNYVPPLRTCGEKSLRRCVYATAEERDVTSLCGDIRTCDVSVNVRLN